MSWEDKTSPRLSSRFVGLYIINLFKKAIMKKKEFDIKKIAEMICDELYNDIDLDYSSQKVWAEIEYNGYSFSVEARAYVDWHWESRYDKYDIPCCDYKEVDSVEYRILEFTIYDEDGEYYKDEELIDEIIKLLEK